MKRLFIIVSLFICCLACTNDEGTSSSVLPPATGNAGDTAGRGDTASYERMPQQTNDSVGK